MIERTNLGILVVLTTTIIQKHLPDGLDKMGTCITAHLGEGVELTPLMRTLSLEDELGTLL
jgi:hypothetical protein